MRLITIDDEHIIFENSEGKTKTVHGKSLTTKLDNFLEKEREKSIENFIHITQFVETTKWMDRRMKMVADGIVNFKGKWICVECLKLKKMTKEEKEEFRILLQDVADQKRRYERKQ